MKTLDEVITVLDGCFLKSRKEWCVENCPYLQNDEQTCRRDVLNDALHYLKEYQTTQMAYIKAMADLEDNPPLTWDKLKGMTGKPVWMEDDTGTKFYRGWAIVLNFIFDGIYLRYVCDDYSETCVVEEDLGKTWQAYRKERG